jgi:hypothetical protein
LSICDVWDVCVVLLFSAAPTMCCGRDGGGGALVSGLWKQASCRGWQGLTGLSFGRGMLSRYTFDLVELT